MKIVKKTIFEVKGKPVLGMAVKVRNRDFTLVDYRPRITRRGQASYIFKWEGICDTCERPFTYETTRQVDALANCKLHRY